MRTFLLAMSLSTFAAVVALPTTALADTAGPCDSGDTGPCCCGKGDSGYDDDGKGCSTVPARPLGLLAVVGLTAAALIRRR